MPQPAPEHLRCVECGTLKPPEAFHRERSRPSGRNRRCKECRNARNREHVAKDPARRRQSMDRWRQANQQRYIAAQRAYKLRSYGLTVEQYEAMLQRQGEVCAVCGEGEVGLGSRGRPRPPDGPRPWPAVPALQRRHRTAA